MCAIRLAAELDQMLGRERGAALVVGHEAEGVRLVRLRIDVEDRNIRAVHLEPPPRVGAPAGDDDAVDALAEQRLDVPRLALRIVGAVAHEDRDAAVGKACSSSPSMIGMEKRPKAVAGDQADGESLAAVQALREVVRAEAKLLGDGDHPGARLRLQAAVVVQRLRDRADADIRRRARRRGW